VTVEEEFGRLWWLCGRFLASVVSYLKFDVTVVSYGKFEVSMVSLGRIQEGLVSLMISRKLERFVTFASVMV
jgi:hypothetical protein